MYVKTRRKKHKENLEMTTGERDDEEEEDEEHHRQLNLLKHKQQRDLATTTNGAHSLSNLSSKKIHIVNLIILSEGFKSVPDSWSEIYPAHCISDRDDDLTKTPSIVEASVESSLAPK
jgi:hypothetical protein